MALNFTPPIRNILQMFDANGNEMATPNPVRGEVSSATSEITTGSIVKTASGYYDVAGSTDSVVGIVTQVFQDNGAPFISGKIPAGGAGLIEFVPFNRGVMLGIYEDADGGTIAAGSPSSTKKYVVITQTILTGNTNTYFPDQDLISLKIDSSSLGTTSASLPWELVGIGGLDNPENITAVGDTTKPRIYKIKPIATKIQDPVA